MESKDQEIIFYQKTSNFVHQSSIKTCLVEGKQDYTLHLSQNEVLTNELALANSDFSIQLLDLNTFQIAAFQQSDFHTDKINAIKFSNIQDSDQLQHVVFSASQDGTVKLWDRRNGQTVSQLKHQDKPFFSVDSDKNIICAGTHGELVFWDLRKMKFLHSYRSAHTDDVTAVRYHPQNPNWLISCSTDNLLNHFDFNGKASLSEDDTMEGVYCSEQPLIDCGFISNQLIWTLTSINTIEIITVENCDVFAKITKFPHQVDYVISCGEDKFTQKFVIYCGNNKGEVFIYELPEKDKVQLVDMILVPQLQNTNSTQDNIVRNALRVTNEQIVLTTESGNLSLYKYAPEQSQIANSQLPKFEFQQMMEEDNDIEAELKGKKLTNKSNNKFKPF